MMAEKKRFSNLLIETMATEESPVPSRQGKILRRPLIARQKTIYDVGLLRMTMKGT